MTEAEARRLAAEEGLVLVPADNSTGFKNVRYDNRSHKSKPFKAEGALVDATSKKNIHKATKKIRALVDEILGLSLDKGELK